MLMEKRTHRCKVKMNASYLRKGIWWRHNLHHTAESAAADLAQLSELLDVDGGGPRVAADDAVLGQHAGGPGKQIGDVPEQSGQRSELEKGLPQQGSSQMAHTGLLSKMSSSEVTCTCS